MYALIVLALVVVVAFTVAVVGVILVVIKSIRETLNRGNHDRR